MDAVHILESLNAEFPIVPWTDDKIRDKCRRMRRSVELSREYLSLDAVFKIHYSLYNCYPRLYYTILEKDNASWESQMEAYLKSRAHQP